MVSWHSREAQPERRATMKRKIYFIVSQLYLAMVFLEHNTDLFSLSPSAQRFLTSIMPLMPIWGSIMLYQLSFRETKKNCLRAISYSVSALLFLVCTLSFAGVISFTRTDAGRISALHYRCLIVAAYAEFITTVINMGFLIRDSYVSDREKGRL